MPAGAGAVTDGAGRARTGRLAAGIGLLLGAHIGTVPGALLGVVAYLPFRADTGGGFDVLVGAFGGALLGIVVGGALGCLTGLRTRWHPHAGRSAATAAVLLTVGLGVFAAVWTLGTDSDLPGWWYLVALEGPIAAAAGLVRRVTPTPH